MMISSTKEKKANRLCYQQMTVEARNKWVNWTFVAVVVCACIPQYGLLLLWALATSFCCPLIVAVMPGLFFYHVLKQNEPEKNCQRKFGIAFAAVGILAVPLFVTLTTKNIFMKTLPS